MALQYVGGIVASGPVGTENLGLTYNIDLTTLTGGIASAPAAGDIVIVGNGHPQPSNADVGVSTAGYTELADLYSNGSIYDTNLSVSYKVMSDPPDTSVTVARNAAAANGTTVNPAISVVHVWRNVDQTTPIDVTTVTATGVDSALPDAAAITPVTAGAVIVVIGASARGDTTPTLFTTPSGFGNSVAGYNYNSAQTLPKVILMEAASYSAWTSGSYNPAAWTGGESDTGNSWAAVTLVLRPSTTQDVTKDSTGSIALSTASATSSKLANKTSTGSVAFSGTSTAYFGVSRDSSGSVVFNSAATIARTLNKTASGQVAFSGAASAQFVGANQATWNSTGSVTFSGAAPGIRSLNKTASGQYALSGTATRVGSRLFTSTGSLAISGTSTKQTSRTLNTGGSIVWSGAATAFKSYLLNSSGSFAFSGASSQAVTRVKNTGGSFTFSGTATYLGARTFNASGQLAFSGVAEFIRVQKLTAVGTGALVFNSAAVKSFTKAGASVWQSELNASVSSEDTASSVWEDTAPTAVVSDVGSPNVWGS